MKLNVAQVIGLNTDQKAAQALSTLREGETFLGVLQITCDDAFTKARQILSELQDFYYEEEGTISQKLNAAFAEAGKKLAETESWDLGLAVVSSKISYLIGKGEIKVYLKRSGQISSLLDIGGQNQLISGFIQEGDRIFITTETLNSFLSDNLAQSLELPLANWEEEISNRMSDATLDVQGLAGLLLEVSPDVAVTAEPAEETAIRSLGHAPAEDNLRSSVPQPTPATPPVREFNNPLPQILAALIKLMPHRPTEYYADSNRGWKGILPSGGRGRLILAVVLIGVLALGIGFKVKQDADKQTNFKFTAAMQQAQDDYNAAQNLKTLNPGEAKNKLDSAKREVNKALGIKPKDRLALDLRNQINSNAGTILQQFAASEFPVFMDLDLIKKDFRPTQMSLSGTKLLLLDPGVKTLVVIDISKKSNQTLAGSSQLGDAKFASINGGIGAIYSKDEGVLRIDTANQKVSTVAKQDNDWGNIADITGFTGNIYLLDSGKNQIWKYLPTSSGYSDKRNYLNDGVKVDFGPAVRMQIESSVYVLKSGGEMIRLTKGAPDNFAYGGLDTNIKTPKSFFVSSDTDNLYLLDSGNSRLVVLSKTGQYKSQYKGDRFGSATDLAVDEAGKKVYLLDSGKIYSTDLK